MSPLTSNNYFITGTDTEVGKSFISAALLQRARHLGLSAFGFKPIAAGADEQDGQLVNEDGLLLQQYSHPRFPYSRHNPIVFSEPQSPHLCGDTTVDALLNETQGIPNADFTLVEGAGGWLVPINPSETLADYAKALKWPVILVVDIRLGCINHALLSSQLIGQQLAGWVANNRRGSDDNMISSIAERLSAPLLGSIGACSIEQASDQLMLPFELSAAQSRR